MSFEEKLIEEVRNHKVIYNLQDRQNRQVDKIRRGLDGYCEALNTNDEQESQKVRVFISELRSRLVVLREEEERIEKVSITLLKKHNHNIPFGGKHPYNPEESKKIEMMRKQVWQSNENESCVDKNRFRSTLRMFQQLQNMSYDPNREEHEEITQLKQENSCIRKKIESLHAYIQNATSNRDEDVEEETCSQLILTTKDVLRKVNELDEDINSVASIIASTGKSFHSSKEVSPEYSGKSVKELFQPTVNALQQVTLDPNQMAGEAREQIEVIYLKDESKEHGEK